MVKPYLSRLRPAEPGRLRPRPHSRFEPPPRLPIDGPAIGGASLGVPPPSPAEAADIEAELGLDQPDTRRTAQAATAAAPGDETVPRAQAAVPERAAPAEERASARAHAATGPPPHSPAPAATPGGDTGPGRTPPDPDLAGPAVMAAALGDQAARLALTGGPGPAAPEEERVPARAYGATGPPLYSRALTAMPADQGSAGNEEGFRVRPAGAVGGEHAPPADGAPHAAPRSQPVPPDRAAVLNGRTTSRGPFLVDPAPPRRVDPTSQVADAGSSSVQGDSAQTDRVQAMARWLGSAGDAAAPAVATAGLSISRQPTPAPVDWVPGWPGFAAGHADVTVTIGRIEVKAPAPDPAPPRPQPSGPRQRVPGLSDYLESRTRATGGLR